jgi:hypothetical protein
LTTPILLRYTTTMTNNAHSIPNTSAALAATETVAFALSAHLALDDDHAEALRRAAGFVLLGRREDALPLTSHDAADRLRWAQELALALEAAMPVGVDVTLPAGTEAEIVRLWERQAPSP